MIDCEPPTALHSRFEKHNLCNNTFSTNAATLSSASKCSSAMRLPNARNTTRFGSSGKGFFLKNCESKHKIPGRQAFWNGSHCQLLQFSCEPKRFQQPTKVPIRVTDFTVWVVCLILICLSVFCCSVLLGSLSPSHNVGCCGPPITGVGQPDIKNTQFESSGF